MQILVVQTAFVGDLFLSIPLLKNIPKHLDGAEITLVCRKGLGDFFLKTSLVKHVKEIEKKKGQTYAVALNELKLKKFDYIFFFY